MVIAGLMLTPFSLASFAANRVVRPASKRVSREWVVAASVVLLVASVVLLVAAVLMFLLARASYLSATALVLYIPAGHALPSDTGYSAAALISVAVLIAGLLISTVFALRRLADGPAGLDLIKNG